MVEPAQQIAHGLAAVVDGRASELGKSQAFVKRMRRRIGRL
jgi:hypothetical protein